MKANANPKANHQILILTYGIVLLFMGLVVYYGYFLQVKSDSVINNSYNARLDSFADRVVRGEIRSSNGQVLARTDVDGEGNETRFTHSIPCLPTQWDIRLTKDRVGGPVEFLSAYQPCQYN